MYLLDTNVVSELRRTRPHGAVVAWVKSVPDADLAISVVTLAEIQAGIEITREQDSQKARELERWADVVASVYNVISMDTRAFRLWAKLMHRQPASLYEDAMIAATAIARDLTIVTRNTRDFAGFGVKQINPFDAD